MGLSVVDYLLALPEMLHFIKVPELSTANMFIYRMLTDYGTGYFKMIRFENNQLLILTADYTPNCTFEKVAESFRGVYRNQSVRNGQQFF